LNTPRLLQAHCADKKSFNHDVLTPCCNADHIKEKRESMETEQTYHGPFAFFRRHYNGDYSLGRSYWVNTFLIQLFAPLLGVLVITWLGVNFPARYGSAAVLLLTLLGVVAWIWGISGTWASANKHVTRGGKQGWASAAKVMIVLGVLRMFGELGSMTDPLGEHWKVATGWQLGPDVTFQIRADGKSLLLKGGINDGTAESLAKALDLAPSVSTIVLQSTGGWIRQGNMIAKVISDRGLSTYVEQECSSACTIAFLAGKQRAGEPNARIGFHSFKSIGGDVTDSTNAATAQQTYSRAGLSTAFIAKVVATSHDKMWYPSHDELLAEGVLTRLSLGGETATLATLAPTREKLSAEFAKVPAFGTLAAKYPREFDAIVETAWVQVQARRPDGEVMAAARGQVSQLTAKLLPIVDDTTLLEFNLLIAAQAAALGDRSPEACVELMFPTGKSINIGALLPPKLATRELELMNEIIRTSDTRNSKRFSKAETEKVAQRVLAQLTPAQIQFLVSDQLRAKSPGEACQALVGYLTVLNNIPEGDRARSIRAIYSNK
jgi:ATP-dependent protease ClpP protease subunit